MTVTARWGFCTTLLPMPHLPPNLPTTTTPPLRNRCVPPLPSLSLKGIDIKARPHQLSILKIALDLPLFIPPNSRQHDHTRRITLLDSRGKSRLGRLRRVNRKREPHYVLHDAEFAGVGTAVDGDGLDFDVCHEGTEASVCAEPLLSVCPDDSESCRGI